jgi:hypothetical protein
MAASSPRSPPLGSLLQRPPPAPALPDEHVARLKAEAEAQDYANRLRVAAEQLTEYAQQKASDTEALLGVGRRCLLLLAKHCLPGWGLACH